MTNLLEALYVLTALALIVALLAWVQSRAGGERSVRYRIRTRRALTLAALLGAACFTLYWYLSPR